MVPSEPHRYLGHMSSGCRANPRATQPGASQVCGQRPGKEWTVWQLRWGWGESQQAGEVTWGPEAERVPGPCPPAAARPWQPRSPEAVSPLRLEQHRCHPHSSRARPSGGRQGTPLPFVSVTSEECRRRRTQTCHCVAANTWVANFGGWPTGESRPNPHPQGCGAATTNPAADAVSDFNGSPS